MLRRDPSRARCAALAMLLACCLALLARAAAAHAVLVEVQPADGQRLDRPPAEFLLRFNEPVSPITLRLLDAQGDPVPGVSVAAQGEQVVLRPAGPLPDGAYLLSYRVTSIDGHPVAATLRFGIGVEPSADEADETVADRPVRWAGVAARCVFYVTALGSAGMALFLLLVRPPATVASRAQGWSRRLALAGILALLLRLGVAGLDLAGLGLPTLVTAEPWMAATGSSLGPATGVAALGLALLGWARPVLAPPGVLLVAASFAMTGHAATAPPRGLTGPALALHVLCAAFWLGSLLPLLWSLHLPAAEACRVLRRFSALATLAVAILLLAGLTLAWVQLGGAVAPLWETAYGLRLMGKLALVAGLLALATVNRLLLTPALLGTGSGAAGRLRASLGADLLLGLGVLAITATFPLDPPPRALTEERTESGEGITVVATAGERQAVLTLLPGRAGSNRLEAWVTDSAGVPVTAAEARLRLALPEAGIEPSSTAAAMPRPGLYLADRLSLPRPGRWQLRLDLRIDDFTELTFEGELVLK